ncbi:Calmodulin-binding transcription activator 1 [Tupaia chinensis]|uniref:Calmodulin-binding transcription activator 1 n=1 Tax=Tupaia chinensis TaxID=246437 RepID=L9L0W4_TUPCH|nr:Calmodulin-binding transcription activator 1 [Tupaia chinensis]
MCLYGCYVHSSIIPTFHRRCYWLLQCEPLPAAGEPSRKEEDVEEGGRECFWMKESFFKEQHCSSIAASAQCHFLPAGHELTPASEIFQLMSLNAT